MAEGRKPYPLNDRGLPVMPLGIETCYEECRLPQADSNRHHLAFPRSEYKHPIERQYRESGIMIVRACVCKHADLHNTYKPPTMPSRMAMIDVVQGDIRPDVAEVFIRRRDA